jgi:hypothetical protein
MTPSVAIGYSQNFKASRESYLGILNPVDQSIKHCRVGIAHPTIAQLVFQDRFPPHSVADGIEGRSPEFRNPFSPVQNPSTIDLQW